MTRKRRREIRDALADLEDDHAAGDEDQQEIGEVITSWELDDDESVSEDALIIDFTDLST